MKGNTFRKTFNSLIDNCSFSTLFINEMGWNNPLNSQPLDVDIDGKSYEVIPEAYKNGFHIYSCVVDSIPNTSECKKIDSKLCKLGYYDYICIFVERINSKHQFWLVPVKTNEKRELVKTEYIGGEQAGFLYQKIGNLSFGLTDNVTIVDVKNKVQGEFQINSEKVTSTFYKEFRKKHDEFRKYITGIEDNIPVADNKKKDWYTSVMLNRLMFCYFIQKKGFLDLNTNYLQDKLKWVKEQQGQNKFYGTFYKSFLRALFHNGLNNPRQDNNFINTYGRIPYLNGGLFDNHQLEIDYPNIDIEDAAFENLFSFFDKWNWHLDTRLTTTGKDINPNVLGYIFEQYINDRASLGAYYTKEDITEYIGKNCIIPFLMDKVKEKSPNAFKPNGFVWEYLKKSGDKYIYDAVKKGYSPDWQKRIPDYISKGIPLLPEQHDLLERRARWNEKTNDEFALPTEIWRETIERLQRCESYLHRISSGDIVHTNDFITYNLDIRQFAEDIIRKTEDHLFVLHFYQALQSVTILDPTCGSGAFLFAALNILEPLYEACLDRMEEWHHSNKNLFADQLDEVAEKYGNNRQYFIYKSIILRNLYGVDIMVEATEIAKLRLFLKMVAVVEVDSCKDNLGLEPLPDVDFNIKCGNTLVGYATEKELNEAITFGDIFAKYEFQERINSEMALVAKAYDCFRQEQLRTYDDNASIKETKQSLKTRLDKLNELLNQHLYKCVTGEDVNNREVDLSYNSWLQSHQPFHWLAEYYQIIKGNGGFDVIIGNPPYLEAKQIDYSISKNYKTLDSAAVHAFCIERSLTLLKGNIGMIVPIALTSTQRMVIVQKLLEQNGNTWYSNFAWRPAKLFDAVNRALTIFVSNSYSKDNCCYTTEYIKWNAECRDQLMCSIKYLKYSVPRNSFWVPKLKCETELSILSKILVQKKSLMNFCTKISESKLYYRKTGGLYWKVFTNFPPKFYCNGIEGESSRQSSVALTNKRHSESLVAFYSSDVFWWWYTITSNLRDLNPSDIFGISIPDGTIDNEDLFNIGKTFIKELIKNSTMLTRKQKNKGTTQTQSFKISKSKCTINQIDRILAKDYGFTEEELDFIINYDIKYRMSEESDNEE